MHTLIVGQSTSGKSWLAKHLAGQQILAGYTIIIYDPLKSAGWPVGENITKFADPEKFLQYIETAQSAFVYVDEAKTLWDYDYKRANKLLYNRRHQGLHVTLIAQRQKMVEPNARDQCSKVYAFIQSPFDARELAENYNTEIVKCSQLRKGEFIAASTFDAEFYTLDYSQGLPPSPVGVS